MSEAMWFILGLLCGVPIGFAWRKKKRRSNVPTPQAAKREPIKHWVETRNFLYYDGTQMPVIKENGNEQ